MKKRKDNWSSDTVMMLMKGRIADAPKSSLRGAVEEMLFMYHAMLHDNGMVNCVEYPCRMFNKENAYE